MNTIVRKMKCGAEDDPNTVRRAMLERTLVRPVETVEDNQPAEDALDYDEASTALETIVNTHSPAPNLRLKRNLEELEHEQCEALSVPISPCECYKL